MRERRIYKARPIVEGGLRCHVPARPGRTTPPIRFLFVAPHLWIGLPPDPASRCCPCPFPTLRLHVHLVRGLPPRKSCAMPGTHAGAQPLGGPCRVGCSALLGDSFMTCSNISSDALPKARIYSLHRYSPDLVALIRNAPGSGTLSYRYLSFMNVL